MLYSTVEYKQAVPCMYENRFLASQFRQNILETHHNGQTVSAVILQTVFKNGLIMHEVDLF